MYKIKPYSIEKAEKLNVKIKPSKKANYKIDVLNLDGSYITSIGDKRYKDFPTYLLEDKAVARERRKLYKIRHDNDRKKVGSRGWFSDKILW